MSRARRACLTSARSHAQPGSLIGSSAVGMARPPDIHKRDGKPSHREITGGGSNSSHAAQDPGQIGRTPATVRPAPGHGRLVGAAVAESTHTPDTPNTPTAF